MISIAATRSQRELDPALLGLIEHYSLGNSITAPDRAHLYLTLKHPDIAQAIESAWSATEGLMTIVVSENGTQNEGDIFFIAWDGFPGTHETLSTGNAQDLVLKGIRRSYSTSEYGETEKTVRFYNIPARLAPFIEEWARMALDGKLAVARRDIAVVVKNIIQTSGSGATDVPAVYDSSGVVHSMGQPVCYYLSQQKGDTGAISLNQQSADMLMAGKLKQTYNGKTLTLTPCPECSEDFLRAQFGYRWKI